jgi:hypothetical protein
LAPTSATSMNTTTQPSAAWLDVGSDCDTLCEEQKEIVIIEQLVHVECDTSQSNCFG